MQRESGRSNLAYERSRERMRKNRSPISKPEPLLTTDMKDLKMNSFDENRSNLKSFRSTSNLEPKVEAKKPQPVEVP